MGTSLITGPRQSGKTTLAKAVFAGKPYVSLEDQDVRLAALDDPRSFLERFLDGAVLDEVQRYFRALSFPTDDLVKDRHGTIGASRLDAVPVVPLGVQVFVLGEPHRIQVKG